MNTALKTVDAIKAEADDLPITIDPNAVQRVLELRFAVQTAELILQGRFGVKKVAEPITGRITLSRMMKTGAGIFRSDSRQKAS